MYQATYVNENQLDSISHLIRKHTLANAIKYDGKAEARAVIGKLLAERPKLRHRTQEIIAQVKSTIKQVNALTHEQQQAELQILAPELLELHRERKEKELPPLLGAKQGKVVTRLPPEPSGYPHIGHAYAGYINWYYARKYQGRLILRFEDTNPRTVQKEYYEGFREGYHWMGIDWDQEIKVSDDLAYFYERARTLLEQGEAYMCECTGERISKYRRTGTGCPHRDLPPDTNVSIWDKIFDGKYSEGEVVCRLKIDMSHINAVMRDPNIFRIIEHPHPFQGDRYRLWPTYDFAVAFEDHLNGITHILRSNEFASRGELQAYIRDLFKLPQPQIQEFSRFSIEGTPASKRQIRPLIKSKAIAGWEDIRLSTLAALRRRAIIPETIKEITREVGMSIAQPKIDWSLILGVNRRLIDPQANRYYYVSTPLEVEITDMEKSKAIIPLHPDFPDRGTRTIEVQNRLFIDGNDAKQLHEKNVFRLKHLYNVRVKAKKKDKIEGVYAGDALEQTTFRIQWVNEDAVPVQLRIPGLLFIKEEFNPHSLKIENGLGEPALGALKQGTILQLERKGFGRIDENNEQITINMTG